MDLQTVLAFMLVAIVVELVPGPNFFLLVRTVPHFGIAAGFGNVGGFAMAFLFHGSLAVFGLTAALTASPTAFDIVKLLGGAYLMGTGTQTLFDLYNGRHGIPLVPDASTHPAAASTPRTLSLAVMDGFLTNLLNPKIALFYLAAFPAFVGVSSAPADAFSLVFVHVLVAISWFSLVALMLARLLDTFSGARVSKILTAVSGLVFVALGAGVVTS